MIKAYIGDRIREHRKVKGLTQAEMAQRLNLSQNYLGAIERGMKIPKLETFIKIVNELEVSADYLLMDVVRSGKSFQAAELEKKLSGLSPEDLKMINDVVDILIRNLRNE